MIRALFSAASGMNAQQTNVDNIANNIANANTAGFKVAARAVSGSAVSEHDPARRRRQPADHRPHRPAAGPGHARGFERGDLHAGRFLGDRQSSGRGDPGKRILPGPQAVRRPSLHQGRNVPPEQYGPNGGSQRQLARSAHHDSAERAVDHHRAATERSATRFRTERLAAGRTDPARELSESVRPEQHRPEPVSSRPTPPAIR